MNEVAGTCLVCGSAYSPDHRPGLLKCTNCGFVSADVKLNDLELENLYSEKYFFGEEYFNYEQERDSLEINFKKRIATLNEIARGANGVLFEIGCAYGYFLRMASQYFQNVRGIDISKEAVRHARSELGVEAEAGDYLSFELRDKADFIVLWDVIEHLIRPDLFIEKAHADLQSGGLIALTTGDIESLNAHIRGKNWRMIHPPTHLHYFSVRTMSMLLNRLGFEIVHVSHPGTSRSIRSILYIILVLRLKWTWFYDKIVEWKIFGGDVTLNLWDIMFVVAKKR
ncbi:MAG: class I SAM-dependent methyltransferase [Alphaproteobacteria bacterium]|nr:class I SAM-dependent methyltransferase [Alphaproteobacteria bacterium]